MFRAGPTPLAIGSTTVGDRQRRLLELIEADADIGTLDRYLHDWWVGRVGFAVATDRLIAGIGEMVVALDATLSSTQRHRVLSRLDDYIDDLEALHREASAVAAGDAESASTRD